MRHSSIRIELNFASLQNDFLGRVARLGLSEESLRLLYLFLSFSLSLSFIAGEEEAKKKEEEEEEKEEEKEETPKTPGRANYKSLFINPLLETRWHLSWEEPYQCTIDRQVEKSLFLKVGMTFQNIPSSFILLG